MSNYWLDLDEKAEEEHEWISVFYQPEGIAGLDLPPYFIRACIKCRFVDPNQYGTQNDIPKCGELHDRPEWLDKKTWETIG